MIQNPKYLFHILIHSTTARPLSQQDSKVLMTARFPIYVQEHESCFRYRFIFLLLDFGQTIDLFPFKNTLYLLDCKRIAPGQNQNFEALNLTRILVKKEIISLKRLNYKAQIYITYTANIYSF